MHGVLNQPRSPQGHPVLVQARGSNDGRALAARHAEAVFSASASFEEALDYAQGIRHAAEAQGRGADAIRIFPGLGTLIGGTEYEGDTLREHLGLARPAARAATPRRGPGPSRRASVLRTYAACPPRACCRSGCR